ncbi:MAG: trypsin-like peptidase domain-containing protein [Burkholderiaceae bacterium]
MPAPRKTARHKLHVRARLILWVYLIGTLLILPLPAAIAADYLDRTAFIPLRVVIVKVEARLNDGRLFVGTGVTVKAGIVLTNCHVMTNAERITVSKRSGRFEAVAQHDAGHHDLCFLKVPKWRGPAIEIAPSPAPKLRQRAAAIGYTGGVEISFSEGRISAIYPYENSYLLQTTSGFSSGASGGALLDAKARLIGILTFRLPGRSGHYYAVPAAWVLEDMPTDNDWQPIGAPIINKPFWRGNIETLPYFMQVAPLQAQKRWADLVALSNRWISDEPLATEPLITKALAYVELERLDEAVSSLEAATRTDARNAQAWFELGRLLKQQGNEAQLTIVRQHLGDLDEALLEELNQSRY